MAYWVFVETTASKSLFLTVFFSCYRIFSSAHILHLQGFSEQLWFTLLCCTAFLSNSFQTFCSYLHQLEPACWHLTQLFIWQPNSSLTRAVACCSQILHCVSDINCHWWEHPSFLLSPLSPHPSMKLILDHYSHVYSVTNPLSVTFSLCHSGCTRADYKGMFQQVSGDVHAICWSDLWLPSSLCALAPWHSREWERTVHALVMPQRGFWT